MKSHSGGHSTVLLKGALHVVQESGSEGQVARAGDSNVQSGPPRLCPQAVNPAHTLMGPASLLSQRPTRVPIMLLLGTPGARLCPQREAGQRTEAGPGSQGLLSSVSPSHCPAGYAGTRPSTRRLSLSFLRRSRRATMSSSPRSGTTFLSQVRPVDKVAGSRPRLPREMSLTRDDGPGS